jgi:O-succinylbenzoate synthase
MHKQWQPDEVEATLIHLEIPLLTPFETATGSVPTRSVGLVSISRSGTVGWGEAAPYPGQDEPFSAVLDAAHTGGSTPTLAAAIDEALADLIARERGSRLSMDLGEPAQTVAISMAIGMGDRSLSTVEEATGSGIYRFKVKIMPGHTDHVLEIRRRFPNVLIGVDANGSFDDGTVREILALSDVGIEYIEQPTPDPCDTAVAVLDDEGFVVFSDESVRSVSSAERALSCPGIRGIVVKPGRLGWRSSVEVVEAARSAEKLWRASGLLETAVGRSFSLVLAAQRDAFVSDVAPAARFFPYDVAPQGVLEGNVVVPVGFGTGIDVDVAMVNDHALEVIPLSVSAIRGPG